MKHASLTYWTTTRMTLILIFAAVVSFLISYYTLQVRYENFEKAEIHQNLERISGIILEENQSLNKLTIDYARWDDSYFFIQNKLKNRNLDAQKKYIFDNYTQSLLKLLNLDLVFITDTNRNNLFSWNLDKSPNEYKGLIQNLQNQILNPKFSNFIWDKKRPLLISIQKINLSNFSAKSNGFLIFGRYLDGDYGQKVQKLANFPFQIREKSESNTPDLLYKTGEFWNAQKSIPQSTLQITSQSHSKLSNQSHTTYLLLVLNSIGLCITVLLANLFLLRRRVLSKISQFSDLADSYRETGNLQLKWPVIHHDELDNLGQSLNEMMEQIRKQHSALSFLAEHDTLTELDNRRSLLRSLNEAIHLKQLQTDFNFCLLLLDLDGFKIINDSVGHSAGDYVLKEIASRIRKIVRKGDVIARLGGDEFALILIDTETAKAQLFADTLRIEIERIILYNKNNLRVSCSIGIVDGAVTHDAGELLRNADLAMYEAKKQGKKRSVIFDSHLHLQVIEKLFLEQALQKALDQNEIEVWFQPIVHGKENQILGMEALARWKLHGQYIPPDQFIPIAEENGMISRLGQIVLEKSCQALVLFREIKNNISCNVNISMSQFTQSNLIEVVESALKSNQLPPSAIHLELTESVIAKYEQDILPTMQELVRRGFKFHLDDFGTGYSSLERLQHLPVDTVKIDRSFVTPLQQGEELMAKTVIELGKSLHMNLIAEGVETQIENEHLQKLGVTQMQGYLFAKPMPQEQLLDWLRAH